MLGASPAPPNTCRRQPPKATPTHRVAIGATSVKLGPGCSLLTTETEGEPQAHSCRCDAWKGDLTGEGVGLTDRSSSTASLPPKGDCPNCASHTITADTCCLSAGCLVEKTTGLTQQDLGGLLGDICTLTAELGDQAPVWLSSPQPQAPLPTPPVAAPLGAGGELSWAVS